MAKRRLGWTRLLGWTVAPLLAVTAACTANVSGPGGDDPKGSPSGPGSPNGAGGTSASGGGNPQTNAPGTISMPGTPIYTRFLRLTNSQWENSVRDILKLSEPTGQSQNFLHSVSGVTDFDNNERVVDVGNESWSDFQLAAEKVAAKVTATDQALQAVVATNDATQFVKTFGRRAFRRELTQAEVTSYTALHATGSSYSGSQSAFTKGAALVIAAMLQSPNFLYRSEMADDGKPLTGYEIAAKLSLWIRDTTPTDAMLDAAAKGEFDTAQGAAAQAKTMLDDPAAVASIRQMHTQLYKIERLDTITKDKVQGYSEGLKAEFTDAANAFFDYIYTQNLGVKDILSSKTAFAGPLMAEIYGVKVSGNTVQPVTLSNRAGWYAQAPFLALWAINNDPDPIHRGVRVNLDTLCLEMGPPAVTLPSVPALKPDQTNRERYDALTNSCGAPCHTVYINPIGFAFEDFDGLGRYRTTDNGKPVDTTGSYPFTPGSPTPFGSSEELMDIVASSTQAHQCWSKKLASFALERDITEAERPLIESLGKVSAASNGSLKEVMLALVQSDAFRTRVGGAK